MIDPTTRDLVKFWTPQDNVGAWCSDKEGNVYEVFIDTKGAAWLRPTDHSYHEVVEMGDIPFSSLDDIIQFAKDLV